jgi:ABC-type multidrug transport system ATPase subunit
MPLLFIGLGVYLAKKVEKVPAHDQGAASYRDVISGFVMLAFLVIAFASVGSNMAGSMSTERHSNSKFLQYVSGISPVAFWTGSLISDLVEYLLFPVSVSIIMIAALKVTVKLDSLTLLLVLFGPAVIAQTYFLATVLPSRSAARWVTMMLNVIGGIVLPFLTVIFLEFSNSEGDSTKKKTFGILEYIFFLIPAYNLGAGLLSVNMWSLVRLMPAESIVGPFLEKLSAASSPLQYNVAGSYLVWLTVLFALYMGLTIWIDNMIYKHQFARSFRPAPAAPIEDESVSRERGKLALGSQETILRVMDVSKQFGGRSPWVVHRVPLAVSRNGEIFTILGENGAGKSTLIKMAIGEILPTDGEVWVDQFNSRKDIKKFRHLIGYCPQFDALIDVLTVKDHLRLYARIKGLSGSAVEIAADHMIEWIEIGEYRNVKAKALSGGYKRRLSLGIALMGNPSLVFLDEPSCGMDPVARRQIWKVIHSASKRFSLVLTTHSMEEAENVSTRIGIMSRGHMMCLGTIPELREKFANGVEFFIQTKQVVIDDKSTAQISAYSELPLVTCQRHSEKRRRRYIASGMTMIEASKDIMAGVFAEWWMQEEANDQIETIIKGAVKTVEEFEASGRSIRASVAPVSKVIDVEFVGSVFAVLEKLRTSGLIEHYSVTQNSLEQVFRSIAAREEAPRVTELLE